MNNSESMPTVEIETGPEPTVSIIWLHGLGADGNDFVPIVSELGLPAEPAVRFVLPHAPMRPVTINQGYVMRAWYDLKLGPSGLEDTKEDLGEATGIVQDFIQQENQRDIPDDRIILAGFSQGGAVALHTALHNKHAVAGVVVLSGYLPQCDRDVTTLAHGAGIPVFMAHGTKDKIVPYAFAEKSRDCLRQTEMQLEWHSYPMEHNVCDQEVADLRHWLINILNYLSL